MFCSTIIPTIARPSLSNTVNSVLNQNFYNDEFEIIVVNDSGTPLPEAEWQRSDRVNIINTNKRNRSVARNTGAAVAKGRYLHFLDDDDWMLPDAFQHLWNLANITKAAWLYGAFRLVDNAGIPITDIYPNETGNCSIQLMAWEWLPLQASFISSEAFFQVDGFASLHSLLGGFEDVDISRQISLQYDIAGIDKLVTVIRAGEMGSTTNYVDMFKQNRQSREKALGKAGTFHRLKNSAKSSLSQSSYWYGKIIYYYLASMQWNLHKGLFFTSGSRLCYAMLGFLSSGRHCLVKNFWRGVIRPHYPRMGTALQEAGADHLYAETRQKIMSAEKGNP